jgi:tetratricopeptide (TPR) repeat protein
VKRVFAALLVLALGVAAAVVVYQAADREREYRRLLSQGDAALRDGQTFGAIENYSGAVALRPDSMLAHLRRGESYRQRAEFEAAAKDFRLAADLDPSAMRPLEALGDVLFQRARFGQAADAYEARLRLDDRSVDITYKLALSRYRQGLTEPALAALAQTIHLNEQFPNAHYLLGVCLREQGRLPEAVAAFEKAVALSYGLIAAREELADLYPLIGREAEAMEQLQALALLDRTHAERQVALGLAQARAGHRELAVLTLGGALGRTTDQPLIYGALGRVWLEMADERDDALSKALEALERVASTPTASSEMMTLYGRALLKAGQSDAAERVLRQATERFPVDLEAFAAYADVAERHGHLGAAREALVDYGALVSNERDVTSRADRIGRLSLQLNQPAIAVTWLRRAAAGRPTDVRVLISLADAQVRAGDRAAARITLAEAREKEPDNPSLAALAGRVR